MEPEPAPAAAAAAAAGHPKRSRSTMWTFTVYNFDDWRPLWRPQDMAYLIWQGEVGNETEREHIQGYVRFKVRKDLQAAKRVLGRVDAHMEVAEGTEEHNHDYCSKEDTRLFPGEEHGVYQPEQGKRGRRSDLVAISDKLKKGTPMRTIAQEHPADFIRYHAGLHALAELVGPLPALERPLEILVLWGPSGTGKTHRALHLMPDAYSVVGCGRDPFGTYTGEKDLILDEFQPDDWKLPILLRVLDKWKMRLDCRYHDRSAAWTRVIICTNLDPESWLSNRILYTEAQQSALRRRVNGCCRSVTSRNGSVSSMNNEPRWPELENGYLPTSLTTSPPAPAPLPAPDEPPVYSMDD